MSTSESSPPTVLERILAFVSLGIIAVALLSFFATLIVGMNNREVMAEGLWAFVFGLSMYALPAGFVLLIVLLVLTQNRRKREALRGAASSAGKSSGKQAGNQASKDTGKNKGKAGSTSLG